MTQTTSELPESPPLSLAARLLWAVLILATLYLCYFHNLGALGLVGPDEPRYAWIARDMAETGDWITPRLYGKPWFEKPPLYYWGAALSFKLFGVSDAAARLPSAVSALLATLAMAWLAWRLYGPETARWLLVLLPTTVGILGFSHAAATDMPFAAMLTITLAFAAHLLNLIPPQQSSKTSPNPLLSFISFTSSTSFTSFFFGVFLGLATLAKGPAAIILSGGAVLLWALFTKRWRDAFRCLHPIAIAGFCLSALPWYVLCAGRNPDFLRIFIIEHNFNRFLTPEFQHIQPFWFYIPILLIALFPWAILFLFLGASYILSILRQSRPGSSTILFLCWAIFPLAFFSASQSKLPGYILPAVPVLCLCLARGLTTLQPSLARAKVLALFLTAIIAAIAALTLRLTSLRLPRKFPAIEPFLIFLSMVFGLMFLLLAFSFTRKVRPLLAVSLRVVAFASFLLAVSAAFDQGFLESSGIYTYSARDLSKALANFGATPQNLRLVRLRRSSQYQLNFYFHSELKDWDGHLKPGELLVGDSISCASLQLGKSCKDIWGEIDKSNDWELLEISAAPSLHGLGGNTGSGGGSAGNHLNDREPR